MSLKYRKDYIQPSYRLPQTHLDFTLHPTETVVKSKLFFENVDVSKPIVLNGEYMMLKEIKIDGISLSETDYQLDDKKLIITPTKSDFVFETIVEINPSENTRLMGLYVSKGMFSTQCEPEGFRSITYYPDHSDVMSKFTVTIHADRAKYPVLLSNGNKIKDDGNTVVWEDPFNKPCYLFALVAGNLDSLKDTYTTGSGKVVDLHLYCEKGRGDRLTWALESLKRSMAWDEKAFGLEYDLDLFNIVAVSHFNMGAMENKSLNIFNDSALLASPDTATDANYEAVEETVAHEYFHNYSGDRVTLRDWFELSLKEGLTVFRHQEYGCDTYSRPLRRIDQVAMLKQYQFPEDDGPLAHPVRPDSYKEIENFYTVTIYEKGAEVIRMQQSLLGKELFRKGCDLYFTRHDGQAVTIDDFVKCMEDVSGRDLTAFKRWYSTAGRPTVKVETHYDEASKTYTVDLTQSHKTATEPFVIPMHYGLVGPDGQDMQTGTLVLEDMHQTFIFENVSSKPVLSINRYFTSPIDLDISYTDAERIHLMTYDTDLVNRYEIGQQYMLERLISMVKEGAERPDDVILKTIGVYLNANTDNAFKARSVLMPSEEEIAGKMTGVKPSEVVRIRKMMRQAIADTYTNELFALYQSNQTTNTYSPDAESAARRAIKNVALGYLALTQHQDLVYAQYQSSDNLTDRMAALSALVHNGLPQAQTALDDFYNRYENDDLVLNKWFVVQSCAISDTALETVEMLTQHPKFGIKNPNKLRSVVGAFTMNICAFNASDGSGYEWFANKVAEVDKINPSMAAMLFAKMAKYKHFEESAGIAAKRILKDLLDSKQLSSISAETVERMLV